MPIFNKIIIQNGIYIDFEKRIKDKNPQIMGVLIDGTYECIVTGQKLQSSAEYAGLEFCRPRAYLRKLLDRAEGERRKVIAYSTHERVLMERLLPERKNQIKELYKNANMKQWFQNFVWTQAGEPYRQAFQALQQEVAGQAFTNIGLKDLLQLVGYDYPRGFKKFSPATKITGIINMLHDAIRQGEHALLTPSKKRDWTNVIKYNTHDCKGMEYLLQFALRAEGGRAFDNGY